MKIEIDESTAKQSYACDDCKYMWLEDTYESMEYREGYSCPKCGATNIGEAQKRVAEKYHYPKK